MKYFLTKTFVEKFELETVKNEQFPNVTIESVPEDKYLMLMYEPYLEKVKEWAERNYPEVEHKDRCSFAGLVMYFATGMYGGYGTALYEKERIAERKVQYFFRENFRKMSAQEVTEKAIDMCIENILK